MNKLLNISFIIGLFFCQQFSFAQENNSRSIIERKEALLKSKEAELSATNTLPKQIILYDEIARLNDYLGNYNDAIKNYYSAIQVSDELNGNKGIFGYSKPWLLIDIGNVLYKIKDYKKAIDIYFYANSIFCKFPCTKDFRGQITCINNIGLCYTKEPGKALYYHNIAKKLSVLSKDSFDIALSNVYLGINYGLTGNLDKAKKSFRQSIRYNTNCKDTAQLVNAKNEFAQLYVRSGQWDSAANEAREVKKILGKKTSSPGYAIALLTEIKCFYFSNRLKEALDSTMKYISPGNQHIVKNKAITVNSDSLIFSVDDEIVIDLKSRQDLLEIAYQCYKKTGEYAKALEMHEQLFVLSDSINNAEKKCEWSEHEMKLRAQTVQAEIKLMEERNKYIQAQNRQSRNLTAFLLLAFAIFLLLMYNNKKRIEHRGKIVRDFFYGFTRKQKILFIITLFFYNVLFFYFFKSTGSYSVNRNHFINFTDLLPGVYIFSAYIITYSLIIRIHKTIKLSGNKILLLGMIISFGIGFTAITLHNWFSWGYSFSISRSLPIILLILASYIVPFNIIVLIMENYILKTTVANATNMSENLKSISEKQDTDKIQIFKSLKSSDSFSVQISNLIAVKADGNYCLFYYIDHNGNINKKLLLVAMKNVETDLAHFSEFFRCHNSYIVNIRFVDKIVGNSRGYKLLTQYIEDPILVSRSKQWDLKNKIHNLISD